MAGKTTKKTPHDKGGRQRRGANGSVILASRPGIKDVVELKDDLTAARDQNSKVVVDAEDVESVDTAVLQLLVAFVNSVGQCNGRVEWKGPSAAFRELADLVDLSEALGIGGDSAGDTDDELCPVF